MKINIKTIYFVAVLVVLNICLAIYATPVSDLGDASTYILHGKTLLENAQRNDLQYRSPLYSIILAGFMLVFKVPVLYKVVIILQYALVAATAWLVYLLFLRLFKKRKMAMLVALLFNLSFSTIFYANILLSEILTAFLLIAAVYLLLSVFDRGGLLRAYMLGVMLGMLSLARFNTIPLAFTFLVLLGYALLRRKTPAGRWLAAMGIYITAYVFIINFWCLYNLQYHGAYRLFPGNSVQVPLNIAVASIRPGNKVSEVHQPVLDIFLKAKRQFLGRKIVIKKGSLASLDKFGIFHGMYSGNAIYSLAAPELRAYYDSLNRDNRGVSTAGFRDFLREISVQNKSYIWKYRFYSFMNGFRAASDGSLPPRYGRNNLNLLPAIVFMAYKLVFLFMSCFVALAFFFFLVHAANNRFRFEMTRLAMFLVIYSFWGINFLWITIGDANRYKFPAEPFIIGLFVFYFLQISNGAFRRNTI